MRLSQKESPLVKLTSELLGEVKAVQKKANDINSDRPSALDLQQKFDVQIFIEFEGVN